MEVKWILQALKDLEKLPEDKRKPIIDTVEEKLSKSPLNGDKTSLLQKKDLEIFRLRIDSDDLNHRVFFDLDGKTVDILGVFHRDQAYTSESIDEIRDRDDS